MTSPETSYDNIRLKIAGLIQNKLFHPGKDNAELAKLSEEFTDLWFAWVAAGEIEPGVNDWLPKLKLSHTGFWLDPEPVCRRTSQSTPRSSESMTARSFFGMFFQVAWRNALELVQEMFWPVSMATMLTVTSRGFNSAAHIH